MTTLPTSADFTTTPGSHLAMRTSLAQQRDYLAGLLGADGLPATALVALGSLGSAYVAKTGAYTATTTDRGKVINASGTWTLSLPAAAAAGSGFALLVKNGGSGVITLDPSGAELVDGSATLALSAGRAVLLSCTGTAWAKVFHSENLLGTVSQSGGVPTGAVFERGSNANGSYTKFADGTMICYHTFSVGSIVAAGAGTFDNPYRSNPNVTWTFPAAFSAVPVTLARAVPPAETSASGARQRAFAAVGRENLIACYQIAAVRMGSDATADVFTIDATVTGRWF